jgi:hypothetical protein
LMTAASFILWFRKKWMLSPFCCRLIDWWH